MPHTINGIGTSYYGKDNLHVYRDSCEHCGTYGELRSYDTRKFFVILFLPVLPLGKYRVLNQCGKCTQHEALKLRDWEQARQETVTQAVEAYRADPLDPGKATEAIQASIGFQDQEAFDELARRVRQDLSNDPDVLDQLGDGHDYFGQTGEAEELLRKAVSLKNEPPLRQKLGLHLLRQMRPEEARQYLWHVVEQRVEPGLGLLFLLVEGYQAKGLHQDALQVLDELERAFPQVAEEKEFKKYRKRSQKNLNSGKPVRSKLLLPRAGRGSIGALSGRGAKLWWATIVIAAFGVLGMMVYATSASHEVYLVNGLDRPYSVRLGGDTYGLLPARPFSIKVPQREDIVVQPTEADLGIETGSFRIELSWWENLAAVRTFVFNPDGTALLIWEQTEYATLPDPSGKEYPYRLHAGERFYRFEGVDYEFREFPEEIDLSSGKTRELKERIYQETGVTAVDAFLMLQQNGSAERALTYLKRVVRFHPDDVTAMQFLASLLPAEEFTSMATPRLGSRPLAMEWHRAYQEVMELAGRKDELMVEYRGYVDAELDNNDLLYLLARIADDADESERLLLKAMSGSSPSAYAHHGLAYQRLAEGHFDDALRYERRALELVPGNEAFQFVETGALFGLRRYRPLLDLVMESRSTDPLNGEWLIEEVGLRLALGDRETSRQAIDDYLKKLEAEVQTAEDQVNADQWRPYLEAIFLHGTKDHDGFAKHVKQLEGAAYAFQAALCSGEIAEAAEILDREEDWTAYDHLLLFIGASKAGREELARKELGRAMELLSEGSLEERTLSRCLSGKAPGEAALRLAMLPAAKAVGLAALSVRFGDRRSRDLARKLNYGLDFQARYLSRVL